MTARDTSERTVRGTQSFVHTMSACWKRPSLTALEILWRWVFGAPAAALIFYEGASIFRKAPLDFAALKQMTLLNPSSTAITLDQAASVLMRPVLDVAMWLVPLLMLGWAIASSFGRSAILLRVDRNLHFRPATVIVLHAIRIVALTTSFAAWIACLRWAGELAVNLPAARGEEPNLVLYCTLAIVMTLGMFIFWATVSWLVSIAPMLAMKGDLGPLDSLFAAMRLGPLRSKLIEINLVMGIVKIALVVLAMVACACPLPFETAATAQFLMWWYVAVGIVYLIASDFFHVVRLVSCMALWEALEDADSSIDSGTRPVAIEVPRG